MNLKRQWYTLFVDTRFNIPTGGNTPKWHSNEGNISYNNIFLSCYVIQEKKIIPRKGSKASWSASKVVVKNKSTYMSYIPVKVIHQYQYQNFTKCIVLIFKFRFMKNYAWFMRLTSFSEEDSYQK